MVVPLTKHPAKFSEPIREQLARMVEAERRRVAGRVLDGPLVVLDPFAGVGRIHQLARPGRIRTIGVEIEEEWAACHRDTVHADAFDWIRDHVYIPFLGETPPPPDPYDPPDPWNGVDVIATSPTYGNRFSDSHNAQDGSTRRSYTHDLGRKLHPNNSGQFPWGPKYWAFHAEAYRLMLRVLRPGGLLLLNVSDFWRRKEHVAATEWHRGAAMGAGFVHAGRDRRIETSRLNGVGTESTAARAAFESILSLRRPEA